MHGAKQTQPIDLNVSIIDKLLNIMRGKPNIAILMSGKGNNADCILENKNLYPNLNFKLIVTDNPLSNGLKISKKYGLEAYIAEWNADSKTPREDMFGEITKVLKKKKIDIVIYAGFMKIATGRFVNQFPGINIHPADLTVVDKNGKPKYTGMLAIKKALVAGEKSVASSVHVVDQEVDCGFVIAVSKHLKVNQIDFENTDLLHERLKKNRELTTYPLVLAQLAKGVRQESLPLRY